MPRESELIDEAMAILRGESEQKPQEPATEPDTEPPESMPAFPEIAWRGVFGDYRAAVDGTTEAPDSAHFATLWAAAAGTLGRRIWMFSGDVIYPNVYLAVLGPTGDRKTTAMRRIFTSGLIFPSNKTLIIRNVGSTEGLCQKLQNSPDSNTYLLYWEELASLLTRGRWSGSTLFEFLVETFDCPNEWGLSYKKENAVHLNAPTPSVLCGSTPEWFWKAARPEDFYGGFGNRFLYISGTRKKPIAIPNEPDHEKLLSVRRSLEFLRAIEPGKVMFDESAGKLWSRFYERSEQQRRDGLAAAAYVRVPVYIRKLAMTYAAFEGTLPDISTEQLRAAIAVGAYAFNCAEYLIDARAKSSRPETELEQKFVRWVASHPGERVRTMQISLARLDYWCHHYFFCNETYL